MSDNNKGISDGTTLSLHGTTSAQAIINRALRTIDMRGRGTVKDTTFKHKPVAPQGNHQTATMRRKGK